MIDRCGIVHCYERSEDTCATNLQLMVQLNRLSLYHAYCDQKITKTINTTYKADA